MRLDQINDEYYMKLAIELASKAQGQTGVNPVVGCVLVKEGRIIGLGSHLRMGTAHAEIHALHMAGEQAEGSTAYVTLEPCSHYGRTPPCSERLVKEKVRRVVVASLDPNPLVSGRGIAILEQGGIEVTTGVLEEEATALNEIFNHYIVQQTPFVTVKTASTLDGRIASITGDSKWISGAESRSYVHTLRHQHQAIMVGVDTVIADNPHLTTRLDVPAIHPIRIILDSKLRIPNSSHVVTDKLAPTIILTTESAPASRKQELQQSGIEIIECGNTDKVDLEVAMRKLGQREVSSILLEGGGRLNGAMLEARLIHKVMLFMAPKIIGGTEAPSNFQFAGFQKMAEAVQLERVQYETFGSDICIIGYPKYVI